MPTSRHIPSRSRTCLHTARDYAVHRTQFGRPLAGFQLTQAKLAQMATDLHLAELLALHLGRLKDTVGVRPEQISIGKALTEVAAFC